MTNKLMQLICLFALATTCLSLDSKLGFDEETLADGYDYSLTNPKAFEFFNINNRKECTTAGQMCKDCTTRVNCVFVGPNPGDFEEMGHHTCAPSETCMRTDCQVEPNPPCGEEAKQKFICHNIGMFPDQFNCQRLHMCAVGADGKFVEYTFQCESKFMYNALTTYCDIPFPQDGFCYPVGHVPQWPVPACLEDGQSGAIPENKSIYYTCEKYVNTQILYPVLRLCRNGGTFDETTLICTPKSIVDSMEGNNGAYDNWKRMSHFNF